MVAEEITKAAAEHIRKQNGRLRLAQALCACEACALILTLGMFLTARKKRRKLRE